MIRLILYYIIFALHLLFWEGLLLAEERHCIPNDAQKQYCSENEICVRNLCECIPGYTRLNTNCTKNIPDKVPSPARYGPKDEPLNEQNSHIAAAIIIPIMLILVVIGSIVLVRKYNVINWVRNKINQRHTPYDEVMIGQDDDDPPLSGV